jgi:hypothetical protein
VDSTGLKLCGAGESLVEKHCTKTRRSCRKLHIGMDATTGEIIAAALTTNDVDDARQIATTGLRTRILNVEKLHDITELVGLLAAPVRSVFHEQNFMTANPKVNT